MMRNINLIERSKIVWRIREFFLQQEFVEVSTPTLVSNPGLEPFLKHFETHFVGGEMSSKLAKKYYLPTSPEYHLKKALGQFGFNRVFEIAKTFRNGETSPEHEPEFTMLEWYRSPGTYKDIARDFELLMKQLGREFSKSIKWQSVGHLTVPDAFTRYANLDLLAGLRDKPGFIEKIRKSLRFKVNHQKLRAGVTGIWAAASIVIIFSFLTSLMVTPKTAKPEEVERYSMYSSKPLKPQTATTSIYSKDSRAQRINEVYKMYNCPLEGLGDVMVYEADKNNIPWWLVAAVSFQESGCGKKSPKIDGAESYNAWGWAIYGDRTFSFDNWVRGIETVSKYFSENFYSKGITDTCEIMKTYTPPSNGSWCEGVNHFADLIKNYKTPQE